MLCRRPLSGPTTQIWSRTPRFAWILKGICTQGTDQPYSNRPQIRVQKKFVKFFFEKYLDFQKKSIVAKTHVWSQMGIRSMITYFWYVPKGYRKQHFHSLIAILKIGILIELFHPRTEVRVCSHPHLLISPHVPTGTTPRHKLPAED